MSEKKTENIAIQIGPGKKRRMEAFFEELGLTLPYGVSIFFEQCIICAGLPQEIVNRDDQDAFIEDWEDSPKTERIIVPITSYKRGQVEYALREAGLTADDAVELYFKACLHEWGIPFRVGYPKPNAVTLAAMAEKDTGKAYDSVEEMIKDLEEDHSLSITVYLGSNPGTDPALTEAVRELGTWIGSEGHSLIYGGSKCGLMGELAESVLKAGGEVTGVEPQFFVDACLQLDSITSLIVTKDMSERKAIMIDQGDAFIAFPGGTGTLEEIAEVMSKVVLGHLDAPCILYNLNGYYDGLKKQLAHMVEMGLASNEKMKGIYFVDNLDGIKAILKESDETDHLEGIII